jgi:hypothetical protein
MCTTGTTLNMVLTRVSQPLRCMSLPYQAGCLSATRSSRGWSTDLGSIVIDSGMLSYLTRKSTLRMGKIVAARATCSCEQQFGTIWHLAMLQPSPEAFSKIDKISQVNWRSCWPGVAKSTSHQRRGMLGGRWDTNLATGAATRCPLS